jgi:hypothetical protein
MSDRDYIQELDTYLKVKYRVDNDAGYGEELTDGEKVFNEIISLDLSQKDKLSLLRVFGVVAGFDFSELEVSDISEVNENSYSLYAHKINGKLYLTNEVESGVVYWVSCLGETCSMVEVTNDNLVHIDVSGSIDEAIDSFIFKLRTSINVFDRKLPQKIRDFLDKVART